MTTAVLTPRYGPSAPDVGTAAEEQASQCGAHPDYPSGVGVCRVALAYDLADRTTTKTLPAAAGNLADDRALHVSYTRDGLVAAVTGPSPAAENTTIALARSTYDGAGRVLTSTDAAGHVCRRSSKVALSAHRKSRPRSCSGGEVSDASTQAAPVGR